MKPLILITNDDGVYANGIRALISVAREMGDVVVMAPKSNSSGKAHSFTAERPLRVKEMSQEDGCLIYSCDGTPVDCVKLAQEYFCQRTPDLVLSGINHGSNSSINVLYSGTMGAVLEASVCGFQSIGFSLLNHSENADFEPVIPYVRSIISDVLENGLPEGVSLNVNMPVPTDGIIKGMKVCRQSHARWLDSYDRRIDPHGRPYYWLTGRFECEDMNSGTDEWALANGYVSIVPTSPDFTDFRMLDVMKTRFE
mgnify:CR=1 FL=1